MRHRSQADTARPQTAVWPRSRRNSRRHHRPDPDHPGDAVRSVASPVAQAPAMHGAEIARFFDAALTAVRPTAQENASMNQDEMIAKLAPAIGLRRQLDPRAASSLSSTPTKS